MMSGFIREAEIELGRIGGIFETDHRPGFLSSERPAEKRDRVCLIDGVDDLFLLRKVTGNRYRILGRCRLLDPYRVVRSG